MKVTDFVATGLFGKSLLRLWHDDQMVQVCLTFSDVRDESQVQNAVSGMQPDWIVLAAAYTDVDGCESNKQLAFDVNCRGTVNVARVAKQFKSRLLFLSTDYV